MSHLDPAIFGMPLRQGYAMGEANAARRAKPLWGRGRYRRTDTRPSVAVSVSYSWTDDQYRRFRAFWRDELLNGSRPMTLPLTLGNYDETDQIRDYTAHATEPYRAQHQAFGHWTVTLALEIPWHVVQPPFLDCPKIYGGPLDNLATVFIYGGPLDNLATDIIAPCPNVDPNAPGDVTPDMAAGTPIEGQAA